MSDNVLSNEIKRVCGGADLRIACAFWGLGAEQELSWDNSSKFVCDLSMGGTNPKVLRELGAPNNANLKAVDGLHAKVFLSSRGGVIGSANISDNGVGFMGRASSLREAGVAVPRGSDEFQSAARWFDDLWNGSTAFAVDASKLIIAEALWKDRVRRATEAKRPVVKPSGASLFQLANQKIGHAHQWGIVFCASNEKDAGLEFHEELKSQDPTAPDWRAVLGFSGWSKKEVASWPEYFVSVGVRGGLALARRFASFPDAGVVLSEKLKWSDCFGSDVKDFTEKEYFIRELKGSGEVFSSMPALGDWLAKRK